MWYVSVKVISYISRGDETGHKMKKNVLFYRSRERQDMAIVPHKLIAHYTPVVTKFIFRQNLLFIKLQIIEYEDWAMHR